MFIKWIRDLMSRDKKAIVPRSFYAVVLFYDTSYPVGAMREHSPLFATRRQAEDWADKFSGSVGYEVSIFDSHREPEVN
jgi:hypothetical protein